MRNYCLAAEEGWKHEGVFGVQANDFGQ